MKYLLIPLVLLLALALILLPGADEERGEAVLCHIGGTMTPLFQDLVAAYQAAGGGPVELSSAGSGELMATIEMQQRGDIYVCHDPYMDVIFSRGLAIDAWYLGELQPVLVVAKGNPKGIHGLADLSRDDVRLHLTDPEYSTLGHMLPTIFAKAGIDFAELCGRKQVPTHRSGSHIANLVCMGNADAALVWQVVAKLRADRLDMIRIDPYLLQPGVDIITSATGKDFDIAPVKVTLISLACASHGAAAQDFITFILGEEGRALVTRHGYRVDERSDRAIFRNGIRVDASLPAKTP